MNNLFFKSASRLIKNSPITLDRLMYSLSVVQNQNRQLRQDLVDVKLMLNKLLIDKHLQMQVDEYFTEDDSNNIPDESKEE